MNLALDRFAEDNAIIDELVFWPPKPTPIRRVRACSSMFRKPFIEVEMVDGHTFQRHFARDRFADEWARAVVVLETLTDIELVDELRVPPPPDAESLRNEALTVRDECIAECEPMYDQGMYQQYLLQFGPNCRDLPETTLARIEHARTALAG